MVQGGPCQHECSGPRSARRPLGGRCPTSTWAVVPIRELAPGPQAPGGSPVGSVRAISHLHYATSPAGSGRAKAWESPQLMSPPRPGCLEGLGTAGHGNSCPCSRQRPLSSSGCSQVPQVRRCTSTTWPQIPVPWSPEHHFAGWPLVLSLEPSRSWRDEKLPEPSACPMALASWAICPSLKLPCPWVLPKFLTPQTWPHPLWGWKALSLNPGLLVSRKD